MDEIVDKRGYVWTQDEKGVWQFKHNSSLVKSEAKPLDKKATELPPYPAIYPLEETYKDAFNRVLKNSVKEISQVLKNLS